MTDTPTKAQTVTTTAAPVKMTPVEFDEQKSFDPDAMFKAAEAELRAVHERIDANTGRITNLRAIITADRAKLKDLERILAARTPRTRKAK